MSHRPSHARSTPDVLSLETLRSLIEHAVPVAQARAMLAGEIRSALEQGEERQAVTLMRRYLGLPPAEVTR